MKKVYAFTDITDICYTPKVFTKKESALSAMKAEFESIINSYKSDNIFDSSFEETHAEILYLDGSSEILDVFEVEIKE